MQIVERLRARYLDRVDVENLNKVTARKHKRDLRVLRTKLNKLPAGTPLQSEALELAEAYLRIMDEIITGKEADESLVHGGQAFQRYVDAVRRVMS
ncbi:hypothetical protein [Rossellomorea sp. LjRoot5]|uniref:hypothetical protein n=1 Tax=Rossellomorea sp. LjRoot5 TaxID=3342331 RepID=UPI003ED1389D